LLESGVSDIGGVNGVPALVKPSSKMLEIVEDELELDVEDGGALSIVAFGIALGYPKHDDCASGRQKVEIFCVSIELGERLLFKEEERERMSNLCRVLRLLSFVHTT
jgi:hypothetical protein